VDYQKWKGRIWKEKKSLLERLNEDSERGRKKRKKTKRQISGAPLEAFQASETIASRQEVEIIWFGKRQLRRKGPSMWSSKGSHGGERREEESLERHWGQGKRDGLLISHLEHVARRMSKARLAGKHRPSRKLQGTK